MAESLGLITQDGTVRLVTGNDSAVLGRLWTPAGQSHFFQEAWNDPGQVANRWLLVRCRSGDGQTQEELVYFSLDLANPRDQEVLSLPGHVASLECSPREGLIAVGGQGTLAIYFAAPTLGEPGKELFSLPGHAGAEVRSLRFNQDGSTLISADSNHRQFGWLSEQVAPQIQPPAVAVAAGVDNWPR